MTALQWRDVAELETGDVLVSIVGYSWARHPALSNIAARNPVSLAKPARAIVVSAEPSSHGGTRVVFTVGSTKLCRTWIAATIVAVESHNADNALTTSTPARDAGTPNRKGA